MKKILLILLLIIYTTSGLSITTITPTSSKQVTTEIDLKEDLINRMMVKFQVSIMDDDEIAEFYTEYTDSLNQQETITYKIPTIFKSQVTCEGIKATFGDVLPVLLDVLKQVVEKIPEYALKKFFGYDTANPKSYADMMVDMASFLVCGGISLTLTTAETTIRAIPDAMAKTTNTVEVWIDKQVSSVLNSPAPEGQGTGTMNTTNMSASEKAAYDAAEKALQKQSDNVQNCMEKYKLMYEEVVTSTIKNFKPAKKIKQTSFCKMVKEKEESSPARNFTIKSPLHFKMKPKKQQMCIKTDLIINCKIIGDPDSISSVKLNEDRINEIIADDGNMNNISKELPSSPYGKALMFQGIEIVDTLTKCINNSYSYPICKALSCKGVPQVGSCAPDSVGITPREKTLGIIFPSATSELEVDYKKYASLLMKLSIKKKICLRFEILNTSQRVKFIQEFLSTLKGGADKVPVTSDQAIFIFQKLLKEEFCEEQFEDQIELYETYRINKYKKISTNAVLKRFEIERTMSKFLENKVVADKQEPLHKGFIDMCSWYDASKDTGDSSYRSTDGWNQDKTSVLVYDTSTNKNKIKLISLSSLNESKIAKYQPDFPVFGVCVDANCTKMKCVYDCKNDECDMSFNDVSTNENDLTGTGTQSLKNTTIKKEYDKFKADNPENKQQASNEHRKIMSETTFLEKSEKERKKEIENTYNQYEEYNGEYQETVLPLSLHRLELDKSLFIY